MESTLYFPTQTQNTKYCPSQPRAMGCGLIRGLTPVATHAHADAPDYRSRSHLRGPISTKPSQRSRALTPLNTPPATGSFNSPWPGMSGAGKRNRVRAACNPLPPGTVPPCPGAWRRMAGWPPSPRVYGLGGGGSGPEKRRGAPRRDTRPNAGFLSLFNLLLLVDALYACYCFVVALYACCCFVVAFICLHLLARRLRGAPATLRHGA